MKILCFCLACGCLQVLIDGATDFIDSRKYSNSNKKTEVTVYDKHWECPKCGHENCDWTSICGKCGRSSRPK